MSDYTPPPTDIAPSVIPGDVPQQPTDIAQAPSDIPGQPIVMPDGSEVLVTGDPIGDAQFNHQQGDNSLGFQSDCGLVSVTDVLNQFGIPVSENDVVGFAAQNGLCDSSNPDPSQDGGTTMSDQVQILADGGISAHAETGNTLDGLAQEIDSGHAVIIGVDSSILWNQPQDVSNGAPDHAITVTGVARDPSSGQIVGFFVNDSGDGVSAKFVDVATMQQAWINAGGNDVVTDGTVPGAQSSQAPAGYDPSSAAAPAPSGYPSGTGTGQ